VNPEWILCSKGKRQSPISIDATKLLFDPYLAQLHIDPNKVRCQYNDCSKNTADSLIPLIQSISHLNVFIASK